VYLTDRQISFRLDPGRCLAPIDERDPIALLLRSFWCGIVHPVTTL
jgi:hypothetical protein